MQPSDFTFAMLAKAVAAAGGSVHVSAQDLLRMNAGYEIDMKDDGQGGQILTLVDRKGTAPFQEIERRARRSESER